MNKYGRVILALAAIIGGFWGFSAIVTRELEIFGALAEDKSTLNWMHILIGYTATVVGVISGAGYRTVANGELQPNGRIKIQTMLSDVFHSRDLWAGLFASPLVFGVLYTTANGLDWLGLIVIAVENGFFCHFTIAQLLAKRTEPTAG